MRLIRTHDELNGMEWRAKRLLAGKQTDTRLCSSVEYFEVMNFLGVSLCLHFYLSDMHCGNSRVSSFVRAFG
jgi:hypothetical protein